MLKLSNLPLLAMALIAAVGCNKPIPHPQARSVPGSASTAPRTAPQKPEPAQSPQPTDGITGEDLNTAVYIILHDRYGLKDCESPECSLVTIKGYRHQIACVSDWLPTLKDARLRDEYESWLEWYEGRLTEAEQKLNHPEGSGEDYTEKIRREFARGRRIADKLPVPVGCKP